MKSKNELSKMSKGQLLEEGRATLTQVDNMLAQGYRLTSPEVKALVDYNSLIVATMRHVVERRSKTTGREL